MFLCEVFARCEVGQMSWKRQECEEWVFGDAADGAEFFWKGCSDGSDFLIHCLVFVNKGVVGRWKWREWLQHDDLLGCR